MISKITLKNVLISALFAISALAAYLAFFGEGNRTNLTQATNYIGIQETTHFPKYILGDIPIILGKIEKDQNAYFHLKLRFRTDGVEGHPNLLQTAPLNKGLRIEFNGSTAAIIVADSNEKEGYRAIILSNAINIGATHELEIEALNAGYVRAILDGHNAVDVSSSGISMEVSQFLVGGGFDDARVFRGQVDNISIKKGNLPPSIAAVARNLPNTLYSSHTFVTLIANAAILISILLCFLINKVIKSSSWITNYFQSLDQLPNAVIAGFVFFQILLMLELPAFRNVVITYLFLFFIGINQYVALTPSFLKERFFYYLFIPFNGLIFLAVLGSYFKELEVATRECNIDPENGTRIVVDDSTYWYFRRSKWPMPITYIWQLPDDKSIRQFFSAAGSDGLIVACDPIFTPLLKSYMPFVKRNGNICCIPKDKLKNLFSLP